MVLREFLAIVHRSNGDVRARRRLELESRELAELRSRVLVNTFTSGGGRVHVNGAAGWILVGSVNLPRRIAAGETPTNCK